MKQFFSIRHILCLFLLAAIIFAGVATYYKIEYWGFSFKPHERTDVWTVDAHISFKPTGEPIEISLSTPRVGDEYKILSEDAVADGYEIQKDEKNYRIMMKSKALKEKQNVYYRIMLYDNEDTIGKVKDSEKPKVQEVTYTDEQEEVMVKELWKLANKVEGNSSAERMIKLLNQEIPEPEVDAFLPVHKNQKVMAEKIISLLAAKKIPARVVRGVKLSEQRRAVPADLMLEVYEGSKWMIYNINTGAVGLPKDFVVFQRGGVSLLDVAGGTNSQVRFSVIKSVVSSFKMAGRRAKYENSRLFDYTIYNLPLHEQNTLKWLMIFPLGILLVVIMRNVIGISTMGTFTPMLVAMSLVKTGFIPGLICFGLIILFGLLIRTWLTKLNLLLVPRISAVVIFVILIMQILTIIGYQFDFKIAASAVFFPIIITAWIIERACITWEEEGAKNATKQIITTSIVAVVTYLVISNNYIRHIMFAFNEWNLVILIIVMLLGTYTGYRLTELKRFAPLMKDK
ncbi:MAG: inactive transglutaminase family protein [Alphaproteobacteria bacterium]|nr:inactive transglutaminase family protein [Alphaproteobacteria bacterium]